ncbi:phosphoribosyltransferase family protein [Actinocorallia sp. API 0066]|uniref:phosphoribosyltransferase family protein n=1 Tax=Actinocorallia sp. API 0066 TaxID=2896846 RepID=UPI001E4753B8|nr:phosphoribosyltransferase family protein [Actinocorallia sp. API 0066]MCD0451091.1 phosphoribosyltransferase family protein [Actinocorallia sp. API 0066]
MTAPVWTGAWVASRLSLTLTSHATPVGLTLPDLVGLAVRRNPRRAHLLVSTVLGKHVPTDPRLVHSAALLLGRLVALTLRPEAGPVDGVALRAGKLLRAGLAGDVAAPGALRDLLVAHALPRRAVVVGYAETATALGHGVADALGEAPYLHSTRRPVPGVTPYGGFEEEHSHATSHLLLPDPPDLLTTDLPLVLVDDELSTGRTVRNTLRALHAAHPRPHYIVASLIDLRAPADHTATAALATELDTRIDVVTLATGTVTHPTDILTTAQTLLTTLTPPAATRAARHADPDPATRAEQVQAAPGAARAAQGQRATVVPGDPDASGAAPGVTRVMEIQGATVVPGAGASGVAGAVADRSGTDVPGDAGSEGFVRVDVGWPEEVPSGGRHGFGPEDRERLEKGLPGMAAAVAEELPEAARRVLVLGFEELMYTPLRLAEALADLLPDVRVRYSTTTRSPVLAVDDPGYAIRNRLAFPAHDAPADGPGERYAYNVDQGFDAVVLVVDEEGDTPVLQDGLLPALRATTGRLLVAVVPS